MSIILARRTVYSYSISNKIIIETQIKALQLPNTIWFIYT